jgi:hypothetical protein
MYDKLLKRLRDCTAEQNGEKTLWCQAADAIEELQKQQEMSIPVPREAGGIGDTCWYCGGKLYWMSDFDYSDVYGEGEGIVSYLHCSNCGAEIEYSLRTDNEEEQ